MSAAAAAAAGGALLAARALEAQRWRLQWHPDTWRLTQADKLDDQGVQGRLILMIDLGSWMLLRFTPDGSKRSRWFAVRRSALGADDWHALRAALHWPVRAPGALSR